MNTLKVVVFGIFRYILNVLDPPHVNAPRNQGYSRSDDPLDPGNMYLPHAAVNDDDYD